MGPLYLRIFLWTITSAMAITNEKPKIVYYLNESSASLADPEELIVYEVDKEIDSKVLCLFAGNCKYNPTADSSPNSHIIPVYQWSQLEYDYSSEAARQSAIYSGDFMAGRIAPLDFDVVYSAHSAPKVFITIPRFQAGVPATLGTITQRSYHGNAIIAPFPSWEWHEQPSRCRRERLVSVFRTKIDECGRLWVLDSGRILDFFACSPQILAFDVQSGKLLHRYEIPATQIHSDSLLVTLIVDVRDPHLKCSNTFVYAADTQAFSLIVYDVQRKASWRIVDKTMYPYPNFGTFNILGQEFDLMDGILGMDISPHKPGQDRVLFYHSLTSGTENWVFTSYIRNQSLFLHDTNYDPHMFHTYRGVRHSQCAAMAIDRNGVAYFGLTSDVSINCWNTATDYGVNNIGVLAQDDKTLQFASGVKVVNNMHGDQELWFLTMRFQKLATDTLNPNEINFRIQAGYIEDLTQGSKCLNGVPGWQPLTLKDNHLNTSSRKL